MAEATNIGTVGRPQELTTGKGTDKRLFSDYCLAHLLRGVILSFLAHPKPYVVARPAESPIPIQEADEQALISFKYAACLVFLCSIFLVLTRSLYSNVLKHANDLTLDHHLVWFARECFSSGDARVSPLIGPPALRLRTREVV